MIIIPAIDLKGNRCVRLKQGRMDDETVYNDDPADVARRWAASGARLIHLVDLDGAINGAPANFSAIERIIGATNSEVEIGGGIRDEETAGKYLALKKVRRIILGTVAQERPEFVKSLAGKHPGRIAVGIDAKDGFVAVRGWVDVTKEKASELAKRLEGAGVAAIIYTDISRDGMLKGPNVKATIDLAASIKIPVVASGGMSSMDDVTALVNAEKERGVKLEGVIVGKALYSGRIDLAEAIRVVEKAAV
jgi:phosphoribosylformimino-5-aminoimidazole carboxamide ribotide isomerase